MIKKKFILIMTTVILSSLTIFISQVDAASLETKRLYGSNRYQTCSEVVKEGWTNSEYAVIVSGENFPDALSASTLAKKYNAPILLTQSNTLDTNTTERLKRLNVKNVFIVGGEGVLNKNVEISIQNLGIQTTRYSGQNRNETSVKIAEKIGSDNGIILTTDSDYTDALSVAPIASKLQMPIILVSKSILPTSVKNFIVGKNIPKTYVLGGTDIISDTVASEFPNVQRIDGSNKYERNINIINTFANQIDFSNICLAYSEGFADALSGSAFAAINGNPIILIGDNLTSTTANCIKSKLNSINKITILGGTAGIKTEEANNIISGNLITKISSDQAIQDIKNILEKPGSTERIYSNPKIKSINGKSYYEILSETATFHSPFDCLVDAQSGDVYIIDDNDHSYSQYIPDGLDLNSVKLILLKDTFSQAENANKKISSDEAMNILKSKVNLYSDQWLEYQKEEVFNEPGIVPTDLVGVDCYVIDLLSKPDICDGTYYVTKQGGKIYFDCQGQWKVIN